MSEPKFWADSERAKRVSRQAASLREEVEKWEGLAEEVESAIGLSEAADNGELQKIYNELNEKFKTLEFFLLFSEKYDRRDVIMAIHAGTGGTEAQD